MIPDWFRENVIQTHKNQRAHMFYLVDGLTDDELRKEVTTEEYSRSIAGIVMHIGTAETYWFHKANESIGPPTIADTFEVVKARLQENTEKIINKVRTCSEEKMRIIPPKEGGPSIAWAVLRTSQHGVYHNGQIAKIRRMIGASELPPDSEGFWGKAADSLIGIIRLLMHDDPHI